MKVVLSSGTGGTGKTTLGVQMFYPRMHNPPFFAIETLNETAKMYGLEVEILGSEKWMSFQKQALLLESVLVEIGSTHTEGSYSRLLRLDGAQAEYDYFVVPVIPTAKALQETASTIASLAALGIDPARIRILFNRAVRDVEEEFRPLLSYARQKKNCTVNPAAVVYENELFDMLHDHRLTINALLADNRDFRALARAIPPEGNTKLRSQYATMHLMQSLARGVQRNLDAAFEAIFA